MASQSSSRSGLAPDLPNPEAAGTSPPPSSSGNGHPSPTEAFAELGRTIGELRSHASYFISAKLDGIKLSVRNVAVYAALGVVGLIAAGGLIVTAVALLCIGLAGAVSAIFDIWWLGHLVVGLLVLGAIAAGTWLGISWFMKATHTQMVRKYERLRDQQRAEFGHDVHDRAAESI